MKTNKVVRRGYRIKRRDLITKEIVDGEFFISQELCKLHVDRLNRDTSKFEYYFVEQDSSEKCFEQIFSETSKKLN